MKRFFMVVLVCIIFSSMQVTFSTEESSTYSIEYITAKMVYGKTTDAKGISKVTLNQNVLRQLSEQPPNKRVQLEFSELNLNKGERIDLEGIQALYTSFNKVTLALNDMMLTMCEDLKTPLANKIIAISYDGNRFSFDWDTTTSLKRKSLFEPVAVRLPYQQNVLDDTLTVVKIDEYGAMIPFGGYFDGQTVTFYTDEPGHYQVVSNPVTFDDLTPSDAWGAYKVERLASAGIIGGRGGGIYDPNGTITRGEFATLITKMLKYDETTRGFSYADVAEDAWYAPYVNAAYTFGIMSGRTKNTFDPEGAITQEEILIVLSKILERHDVERGNEEGNYGYNLKTENASSWAKDYIEIAITNGALKGIPLSNVNMSKAATRLETANMLYEIQEELYK